MATFVLPGDHVPAKHVNLKLGPGLLQLSTADQNTVIATRAGELHHSANRSKWWVENNSRRYVPASQELVVGVITHKVGEGYRVDIGGAHPASLDGLAFEGATKRNKPNLKACVAGLSIDTLLTFCIDMEPELECFDAQTRKADGFGELKGGFVVKCSLKLCRDLLDPKHFLLPLLGGRFPLEVAVGMNGRVWVSAKEIKQTIAMVRCIEAVDPDNQGMDALQVKIFLDALYL